MVESPLRAIRGASERRRWRSMAEDMVVAVSNDEKPVGKTRSREDFARNRAWYLHESQQLPERLSGPFTDPALASEDVTTTLHTILAMSLRICDGE